ncbi:MAG: ABC transporter ATP-binding protein [Alphaproteobacteria bacterium]|nr:MAG: ABC transporter ATP-binding protein [Alphaproteobacteria bacterium]
MYAIEALSISKRFGAVQANRDVTLQVAKGTIHGLVGENGAGKSTLMNMLYGFHAPDHGTIKVDGKEVSFKGPVEAIRKGLGMVHQHFMLVDTFTVIENIVLGFESDRRMAPTLASARDKLLKIEETYGLAVDLDALVADLPVGTLQRVEILKALYRGAETLILDEPTGVLTPQETAALFEVIKTLRGEGKTVLLITHKLGEIMGITDNVSVMRAGTITKTFKTSLTNENELAEEMVGRTIIREVNKELTEAHRRILRVDNLYAEDDTGKTRLNGVSFDVHGGEILGIAGVSGNGQSELLEIITGMRAPSGGSVIYTDLKVAKKNRAADAEKLRGNGMGHVAEDRHRFGMVGPMTAAENTILGYQGRESFYQGIFLDPGKVRAHCQSLMDDFDVRPPTPDLPLKNFSGGNQQKLVMAREMAQEPDLLIVGQPTRGVDIGAIAFIHSRLVEMRNKGRAILMVSSELEEIMTLSDRIIVLCDGRITGTGRPEDLTETDIGLMMAGRYEKEAS